MIPFANKYSTRQQCSLSWAVEMKKLFFIIFSLHLVEVSPYTTPSTKMASGNQTSLVNTNHIMNISLAHRANNSNQAGRTTLSAAETVAKSLTYWQIVQSRRVNFYATPIILVIGTVGNLFAVAVLQNRLFKSSSTSFILTALAISDILLLDVVYLVYYVQVTAYIGVRALSSWGCKIHVFLSYLVKHLASWTMILLTVERTISVLIPFKCKEICSLRNIVISWSIMVFTLVAINFQLLVGFDLQFSS